MIAHKIEPDEYYGPTVYERDGAWFWADECWQEHGPCSSRESATRRQGLYVRYFLEGDVTEGLPVLRSVQEWRAAKDAEATDATHPCDWSAPWDCMCAGACSCHWKELE